MAEEFFGSNRSKCHILVWTFSLGLGMPKEQPCLSERSPCTSSKNAKDKSNSTTLLALRGTEGTADSSGRGSRCSSEKDSGFSDNGSDWQQTDVEDQRSSKSQPRGSGRGEAAQPGPGLGQGRAEQPPPHPGNPIRMPGSRELPPIYIIKNMPDMIQKRGQLLWGNCKVESGGSGGAHVIVLRQPRLAPVLPVALQLHKSRKTGGAGRKISGTFLPILNSYPRIAPHPSKKPPDKTSVSEDSQNLSKRVCTEHKSDGCSATSSLLEKHLRQPELAVLSCSNSDSRSSSGPTVSSSLGSPPASTLYNSSSFLATRGPHRNGVSSTRHRRFLNTLEILRQSGLLDITLRTRELLRQSNATERDIAQLRQHTQLLCQAASEPADGNAAWEHLRRAMAESGGYPDLRILRNERVASRPDSASRPESGSVGDADGPVAAETSGVPSAPLLTPVPDPSQRCPASPQSHSEQGREHKASGKPSEKVTFVPPDSSTG
ncbi:CLOCK-interacting pacemaker isoform X2 [Centroberyx affinis]|uniref:CLOCK-interacting pacemaker isoform X2 n=1 Tax=Centroberyx affinis TaxID=166261 RepID=UPI003A5BD16B